MNERGSDGEEGIGEFELICELFAPLTHGHPAAFNLTDDAALIDPPQGCELVLTADAVAAGIHFRDNDPPDLVARKLLRVNLSDLAAKGARPIGYLLTCAWPKATSYDTIKSFAAGLAEDYAHYGVPLLGGDTSRSRADMSFSLTALGAVAKGAMLRRGGARPGDLLYVSGSIGDAVLGLDLLEHRRACKNDEQRTFLTQRYLLPQPRLSLGQRLAGLASASIDVSDGLVADAGHIAECSGVRIRILQDAVPLSRAARALSADPVELMTGGDDYELLFTIPPQEESRLNGLARELGVALTAIGHIEAGKGVIVADGSGRAVRIPRAGYEHF